MKEFTDDEKIIARNIDKEYKWMARSKTGTLRIFKNKPIKIVGSVAWDSNRPPCVMTAFRQIWGASSVLGVRPAFQIATYREEAETCHS